MVKKRVLRAASLCICVVSFVLCLALSSFAKDINFEAVVEPSRISLGQTAQLNLTFVDTQGVSAPQLPEMDGFQWRYLGPSTRMSIVNGAVSSSITHIYTLLPVQAGSFTIGPFTFTQNGTTYTSNPVTVEVVQGQVRQAPGSSSQQVIDSQDLSDRAFVVMEMKKNKTYVNEIVPATIKLYVHRLGIRDIQYPTLAHEGISLGEFLKPKQYQETLNGIHYEVIEFDTVLFGLRAGEFTLGPAQISGNLIVRKESKRRFPSGFDDFFDSNIFDDFFGRYQTYPLTLKSADMAFTVMPLPQEGKPADFNGAIGNFTMKASAGPEEVKVGDPVTLKVSLEGEGNFNTVTMPRLRTGDQFKVYEPLAKQKETEKSFEQILIPLNASVKEIPEFNFSFFDTELQTFRTITQGPFPLKVSPSDHQEQSRIIEPAQSRSESASQEKLGRDIVYLKESMGKSQKTGDFLYRNSIFLSFQAIPLLLFLAFFGWHARFIKLKTDVRYARQRRAPGKAREGLRKARGLLAAGKRKQFYDAIFQTLQEYLGDKFHLPSQAITVSIIDETLKGRHVPEEILIRLKSIFLECDMARFSSSEFSKETMEKTLEGLEEVIDYFQRNKL